MRKLIRNITMTSHKRHVVPNHRSLDCLVNGLSGPTSKKDQSPHYCGQFTGDREFPAQRANNAEKASIWWRHHEIDTVWAGQCATPVRGAPGWLALNPVGGMREPPSGSMQLQKLQFQSVIYGNPEHSNWHQSFPTHIWLFLAQCGTLAGFIKTMQAE